MILLAQGTNGFASWGGYWQVSWFLWLSAICVVAIYSYLFRDNAVYRTIVQMFIGISIGYGIVITWKDFLWPQWWLPMVDGVNALLFHKPGSPWGAMWVVVGLLGLSWYFQLSRKYFYLSRFVIGISMGIGAGLTFQSQLGQNIPQVVDSFRPLAPSAVGPAPLRRFALPPSVVPPALADPVVYVAQAQRVQCVELIGGLVVWSTPLAETPTRALRVVDDDLLVPTARRLLVFDRNTGMPKHSVSNGEDTVVAVLKAGDRRVEIRNSAIIGFDHAPDLHGEEITSACVMAKLQDDSGKERDVVFVIVGGVPEGLEAPSGKVLWVGDLRVAADEVYDGGRTLFVARGRVLKVLDPNSGQLLKAIQAGAPVGASCVAHMSEPVQDQIMAIMPVLGSNVEAAMVSDDGPTGRTAGEILWKYDTGKTIVWTDTLDGVLFTDGPQGGACYEIPQVQQRLAALDYTDNWVFIVALLSVMTYFFFSFRQATAKGVSQFARIGRWTLMIGFGAIFGNTIMTRMSFLLDRLMFLHDEWWLPFWHTVLRLILHQS